MNKNNWTYKKFGDVASFSRGLTYSKSDVAEESYNKVLRSNNIDLDTHLLNFDDVVCLKEDFMIPADKKFKKNDIFICMSNGSTKHLGKVAFIEKEIDYAFGGFMGAIHPKVEEVYPKFTFYYCLSSEYRRSLASVLNGININNIKWSDLSKFPIPIPPLAEQQRIVAELDLLSSIIEKKKAQLKELDQLAQSIFYNMFGDPITNEKGWKVQALSTVCDVRDGTHDSPKYVDNGYPLITSKNVVNGTISFDNVNLISERDLIAINARSKVDDGDIIMPMIGTIGKPTIVIKTREFAIKNVALIKFSEAKRVLNIYIQKLLDSESYSRFIKEQNRGGTQKFISLGMIRKLPTPLPPLPLQQEFASKVEAIERQKSLIQQSIDEVQTLFDSRMDYWFG